MKTLQNWDIYDIKCRKVGMENIIGEHLVVVKLTHIPKRRWEIKLISGKSMFVIA